MEIKTIIEGIFGFQPRPRAQDSIVDALTSTVEPSVLIFGPSKTGKSRLAAFEAVIHAQLMNKKLYAIYSEPNIEAEDFADIVSLCAHYKVSCEIVKMDRIEGIRKFVKKVTSFIFDKRRKKIRLEDFDLPSVVLIDSITALSEMVTASQTESMLENPQGLGAYHNPYQIAILDPLRRLVSISRAMMYMVAHETQTRGVPYNPRIPSITAKPRYVSAGRYKEDLEVYMTDVPLSSSLTERMRELKREGKAARFLTVVRSRRCIECEGRVAVFYFEEVEGRAKGYIEHSIEPVSVTIKYVPEEMAEGKENEKVTEIPYRALIPRIYKVTELR